MLEFIKMFGLGIVYTLLSPIFALILLVVIAYSVVNYLVLEVINLSGFFFGRRVVAETKLDKQLKLSKEEEHARKEALKAAEAQRVSQMQSFNEPQDISWNQNEGGDFHV